jgi:hypothetical protein
MEILAEIDSVVIENDEGSNLIDVDEDRLNELIQLAKHFYPDVPESFIFGVAVEQCMIEAGYEPDEELANELYKKAQEELKNTEYNITIVKNLSE